MSFSALFSIEGYRHPLWLFLILVPVLSILIKYFIGNKLLPAKYFDPKMSYWYLNHDQSYKYSQRKLFILDLLFWLFFSIALAGPEFAEKYTVSTSLSGDTILVVLDTSSSMNAIDHKPTRLQRARTQLLLLTDKLKQGDKLGLLLYAGAPHLLFPPTTDKDAIRFYLDKITEDMLPTAGANISAAIHEANKILQSEYSESKSYILLVSDGDINNPDDTLTKILKSENLIPIYTLGLGKNIDTPVPAQDKHHTWSRLHSQPLITNRNDIFLQNLADKTGGRYHEITESEADINFLYRSGIKSGSYLLKDRENINWIQFYHGFLLLAALIIFYKKILISGTNL